MGTADELESRVARLRAEAAALAVADLTGVDPRRAQSLHRDLRTSTDQLGLAAARLLARVEADGAWAASGSARTFPEWAAQRQGSSVGAARRELTLGQAVERDLPQMRAAVASGEITLEHAEVLARIAPTSPARQAALAGVQTDRNETFLLTRARAVGVDDFRREARRWAARVDADAAEREHERATAKEFLTVSRRDDGVALQGFLNHEHGAALITALRAVGGVPSADDERTPQERDGSALGALARLVLDKGLAGGGAQVRPHLTVHVSWETLQGLRAAGAGAVGAGAGGVGTDGGVGACGVGTDGGVGADGGSAALTPAELEDGEPLPRSVLERLACDGEVSRVVFGPDSQVLDVGRAHRTYSGQLRRAVVARDRTCRYPGCSAPPSRGEVHHVKHWIHGGPTSVANGILLCWYHHELVHRRHLQIHASPGGGWEICRADGAALRDTGRAGHVTSPREGTLIGAPSLPGADSVSRSRSRSPSPSGTDIGAPRRVTSPLAV
ncbi:HNH endonuclease signature motif containing protein [Actinotalea sp. K2]|uniref:HNH endonuclease signature motif containing protein n=1 Tax=Actinotalea sp. K2 TaxID=2939438 RepID=UPI00201781F7|nr:HNH endonuclease signature motif containing protein [Actinotalea sp. K2]MCL3861634.1 HNH endonuclease [Actinotalea sp. K2]